MNWYEIFEYKNGELFWKTLTGNRAKIGRKAGKYRKDGYCVIGVKTKTLYGHRIIWEMHNGLIPEGLTLDHIDGNPSNNRLENLRLATHQQNLMNQKKKIYGKVCYKGVWLNKNKRYVANIHYNGKTKYLGTFDTPEQAAFAYNISAKELFGEYAHLNEVPNETK